MKNKQKKTEFSSIIKLNPMAVYKGEIKVERKKERKRKEKKKILCFSKQKKIQNGSPTPSTKKSCYNPSHRLAIQ